MTHTTKIVKFPVQLFSCRLLLFFFPILGSFVKARIIMRAIKKKKALDIFQYLAKSSSNNEHNSCKKKKLFSVYLFLFFTLFIFLSLPSLIFITLVCDWLFIYLVKHKEVHTVNYTILEPSERIFFFFPFCFHRKGVINFVFYLLIFCFFFIKVLGTAAIGMQQRPASPGKN